MWFVAPGCSVAPVRAPLLSVVAPGGSVAPFFLRFPRRPRSLLLVAASLLLPCVPFVPLLRGSMGLWAAAPMCSVEPVGAPWLSIVALGLPRCFFAPVVSLLLPVVASGCSAVPSLPGVVPVRSVAPAGAPLLPAVAPGRSSSFAPVGRCSASPGCWSRVYPPLLPIRTTKKKRRTK